MVRKSRQAGDEKCDEIEVTPEMIEAGALLLSRIKDDLADGHIGLKEVALLVYSTMSSSLSSDVELLVSDHPSYGKLYASYHQKTLLR